MSTANDNTAKWAVRKFGGAGLPVGFEYLSMNPNIPAGSLPLLGGVYSRTVYKDLWAWVQEQAGYLIEESVWQAKASANDGNVPFYSKGDGSTTFRVPSLKCWVKGANGIEEVGSYLEAGLPNITDNTNNTAQLESIVGMWLVKAYGTVTNSGNMDIDAIAQGLTELENRVTPINKGGTGVDNAGDAMNDFINALSEGNSAPVDDDYFISQYVGGGEQNKTYYRRKMSYLWGYIKSKLNGVTAIPANSNLDNYKTTGVYSCLTSSTAKGLSNNPMSSLDTGIILEVIVDGDTVFQKIYGTLVRGMYTRRYASSWNTWKNINNGIKGYNNVASGYIIFENNMVIAWTSATISTSNKVVTKPTSFKTLAVLSGDRGDSSSKPATQAMVRYDLTTNTTDTFLGASGSTDVQYIMWIGYKES